MTSPPDPAPVYPARPDPAYPDPAYPDRDLRSAGSTPGGTPRSKPRCPSHAGSGAAAAALDARRLPLGRPRSEEHTSELQSLMRISYAVFCLKKKKKHNPKSYMTTIVPTH